MELDDYLRIKRKAEEYQREADRTGGQAEQIMKRLKEEHGVSTIKEAKALRAELVRELETAESGLLPKVEEYETRWGERL